MLETVNEFLTRAAIKSGFIRENYIEKLIPKEFEKIVVIPFFGDLVEELVFSYFIVHRLVETEMLGKYVIIATHPGRSFLYSEIFGEVWNTQDDLSGLDSKKLNYYHQTLNKFFPKIYDCNLLSKWYSKGLTKHFLTLFGKILIDFSPVSSAKPEVLRQISGNSLDPKVFLMANKKVKSLDRFGKDVKLTVSSDFYVALAKSLIDIGLRPVFWQGTDCYDISQKCVSNDMAGKVGILTDKSLSAAVATARSCDLVCSIFNDLFTIGLMARVPYFLLEDRRKYFALNLFEIEDLVGICSSPKPYFSFANVVEGNFRELVSAITNRIEKIKSENYESAPINQKRIEVDYGKVRKRRTNRLGFKLFQVPKCEDL